VNRTNRIKINRRTIALTLYWLRVDVSHRRRWVMHRAAYLYRRMAERIDPATVDRTWLRRTALRLAWAQAKELLERY
jgi:hypothetical protein